MEQNEKKEITFQKLRLIIVVCATLVVLAFLLGIFVGASTRIKDKNKVIEYKENNTTEEISSKEEKEDEKEEREEPTNEEPRKEPEEKKEEEPKQEEKKEDKVVEYEEKRSIDNQIEYFIRKLPAEYTNVKANDLTNQEKLNMAFNKIYYNYGGKNIPDKDLTSAMKELFGESVTYKNEDIYSLDLKDELISKYNSAGNYYTYPEGYGRGSCYDVDKYEYIISKEKSDNTITVTTKVVYEKGCTGVGPLRDIYKDNGLKEKLNIPEKYCNRDMSKDYCAIKSEEYFKDNKDSLNTLIYTFEINNNIATFKELKS